MNSTMLDFSGIVPYIDLADANSRDTPLLDMPFPKSNLPRKYPQISIPVRSLNRISKLPSPQRRSCRRMKSINDASYSSGGNGSVDTHGRISLVNQALQQQQQQQQQQQHQYWNSQFSSNEIPYPQSRQPSLATSSNRPSSWHCSTLEPFQYLTPVITRSYPCNSSNLTSTTTNNNSNSNSDNNNFYSVSYSAPISPEISSSSPLLSPSLAHTKDNRLSQNLESPLHFYSDPALFDSNYHLLDKTWTLNSVPQKNYFAHSPFTRDERDYFHWNLDTSSDCLLEYCSLTSPPTPNDTLQSHLPGQPYLAETCVSNPSFSKNQAEEELIGMGLYDRPEPQKSPMFQYPPSLDRRGYIAEVQGINFVQGLELQGKGLKLEETFTPTLSDDDSVTDDDDNNKNVTKEMTCTEGCGG